MSDAASSAPETRFASTLSLNRTSVGMARMPMRAASVGACSVLIFTKRTEE